MYQKVQILKLNIEHFLFPRTFKFKAECKKKLSPVLQLVHYSYLTKCRMINDFIDIFIIACYNYILYNHIASERQLNYTRT